VSTAKLLGEEFGGVFVGALLTLIGWPRSSEETKETKGSTVQDETGTSAS